MAGEIGTVEPQVGEEKREEINVRGWGSGIGGEWRWNCVGRGDTH